MGLAESTVQFDLMYGNGSKSHTFKQHGTIKKCMLLPGPINYSHKQCAVVVNEVMYEKLRFYVYDERYNEVFELFQTTRDVQKCYSDIVNLFNNRQPGNLRDELDAKNPEYHKPPPTRSYLLQDVVKNLSIIRQKHLLCAGDLIARPINNFGPGWHFGVYFDNNTVYHWISKGTNNKSKGKFGVSSFLEFMKDKKELYVEYSIIQIRKQNDLLQEAKALMSSNEQYDLVKNNCEHLAKKIFFGVKKMTQVLSSPGYRNSKCIKCNGWKYVDGQISTDKWGAFDKTEACDECKKRREKLEYASFAPRTSLAPG